jgi:hypothetical protein
LSLRRDVSCTIRRFSSRGERRRLAPLKTKLGVLNKASQRVGRLGPLAELGFDRDSDIVQLGRRVSFHIRSARFSSGLYGGNAISQAPRLWLQSLQEQLEQWVVNLITAPPSANEQAFVLKPSEIDAVELLTNLARSKFLAVFSRERAEEF